MEISTGQKFLFLAFYCAQRIDSWLIAHIIRRVTGCPGNLIYDTSGIFRSQGRSTEYKPTFHLLLLRILLVRITRVRWKFVEATGVISARFLGKRHVNSTRSHHFRFDFVWSYVSGSRVVVLVRIRWKMIKWCASVQKSIHGPHCHA